MPRILFKFLCLIAALTCLTFGPTSASAQSTGPCGAQCGPVENDPSPTLSFGGVSISATDSIVSDLTNIDRTCSEMLIIPPPKKVDQSLYRIDCYRILYKRLADRLPNSGDYLPIKQALLKASRDLDRIVTENLDPEAPKISVRERARPNAPALDGIRAIKKANKARAYRAANKVIKETAIVILRAGEIPTRRNVHYTRIAGAVQRNLVVLRSA